MDNTKYLIFLGIFLHAHFTHSFWMCTQDAECDSLSGSVCVDGACVCPTGTQSVLGGSECVNVAPYHASRCVEDHQCARLFTAFECRINDQGEGTCLCQPGHHYFMGRCWESKDFGDNCTRSEECMSVMRDPFSLTCNGNCECSDGYYNRQRGECRRIGFDVGDGCVLDEDCQFDNGACDHVSFTCYDSVVATSTLAHVMASSHKMAAFNMAVKHDISCDITTPCPDPLVCVNAACVCPLGYYMSSDGSICLAELGSPSTAEQCVGFFAVIIDSTCTCPANFFFEENMRDCVKATRRITDSCVADANCHTFGAQARCGDPQSPWGLRSCECVTEHAVWDARRQMCRLFAGVGERCEVSSDCLAGELEIQCLVNIEGIGYCTCPNDLMEVDGLCLTTGLELGEACQATFECTGTANTVCVDGRCSCGDGYREYEDQCSPIIGGACYQDADCVIEHTICKNGTDGKTCQCGDRFVDDDEECWPFVEGYGSTCNVTAQCVQLLGAAGDCVDDVCTCSTGNHYRDDLCWPITNLFEACSRTSQCFLGDQSQRVVCRNSLCQCEFHYPYSEELNTCVSSTSLLTSSSFLTVAAMMTIYYNNGRSK